MDRVEQEIAMLKGIVPDLKVSSDGRWVLIPNYKLPEGWVPVETEVAIYFRPGYEQCGLYGIYTRSGLLCNGATPNNYAQAGTVPFEGTWFVFSWEFAGWQANADVHKGSNVTNFYYGFAERFRQGV